MNRKLCFLAACIFGTSLTANAAEQTPLLEKVKQAMKSEVRTEKDMARDRNRAPLQAIEFWGMTDDMTVVEFLPGAGWYTKLLAPALRDKGQLHLVTHQRGIDYLKSFTEQQPYDKVIPQIVDVGWNREQRRYDFNSVSLGVKNADMVINIREYHNFNGEDKAKINKATFAALKPGGLYVIVDHSRRHMAPESFELRRREDPVQVILEVQDAGFKLLKSSDMFYRPDDEMVYEVGRKSVTGNTDRFSLVFQKPE